MLKIILITLISLPLGLFAENEFSDPAERDLVEVLNLAKSNEWLKAEQLATTLTLTYPKFRAGKRLLEAVTNKTLPNESQAEFIKAYTNEYTQQNLDTELSHRWAASQRQISSNMKPASIIQLASKTKYALVVETLNSRIYLFENINGQAHHLFNFYSAVGKQGIGLDLKGKRKQGDHKTPIGVYRIDGLREDNFLQEIYGNAALTLNYPNILDRLENKTGNGIWIHGVPRSTYTRPPNSSRGCVTVNNQHISALFNLVEVNNTPVIIVDKIKWIDKTQNHPIQSAIKQWEHDWETIDIERYFSHYQLMQSANKTQAWKNRKRNIQSKKTHIDVNLKDISLFQYPHNKDIVLAEFKQEYTSNNFSSTNKKNVYWQRFGETYKIINESVVRY